jgi:hypothetical protein
MAKSTTPPFSCDLVANARLHVLFLRTVHISGVSLQRPSAESIRRYKDLWLPLVATAARSASGTELIPPIDVAWLWHCHRLAPYDYGKYMRVEFRLDKYLDANPPFALQCPEGVVSSAGNVEAAAQNTQDLWSKTYADEPFFIETQTDGHPNDDDGMLHTFDLAGSCERQATFLWQVTQERFGDEDFLVDGVEAYCKFLKLRSTEQGREQIIVPTYQIDLMWHTHILSSLESYDDDCRKITGRTLHHDDSLNDRSEGSTLNRAFGATKQIWREVYNEDYVIVGGMYRGEPPKEFYANEWAISHPEKELQWPVISPEVEGTTMASHRIAGASSTGSVDHRIVEFATLDDGEEGGDKLEDGGWLTPSDTLPSGEKCFIEAAARSRTPGETANPQKDNYVFGSGELGPGYYHVRTKEAYKILARRVDRKIGTKETEASCANLWTCFCPTSSNARKKQTKVREELEELTEVRGVLEARYRANSPSLDGVVGLPRDAKKDAVRKYYNDDGGWLFPVVFYDAGGGCGAIIDGLGFGGGCGGGGACGMGGGCGAGGGCGGGGCGGGGCGGGGCGC